MNELKENSTVMLVAAVAMVRADGQVLMQRRRNEAVHGGLWEFPGGKVEAGESVDNAALREIEEELGVVIEPAALQPVGFATGHTAGAPAATMPLVILLYSCTRWSGDPQCRDAEECAWFDPAALSALAMPPLDYPLARALGRWISGRSDRQPG